MKKHFLLILFALFVFAFSNSTEAANVNYAKNLSDFEDSLLKIANRISWESPYSYQEKEFVENEMLGDETVYERAWVGEYYFVVRSYSDKTYSSSVVTHFWTESAELDFAGGIKIGSSLSDVYAFLGRDGILDSEKYTISDDGFWIDFRLSNGRVSAILYSVEANLTSTIASIGYIINGSIVEAEITGEKVNVRNAPSKSGKILFQVSRSKGDKLIVNREAEFNWHNISYRLIEQGNSYKVNAVNQSAYIIGDFIRIRPLSKSTRDFLIQAIERKAGRDFIINKSAVASNAIVEAKQRFIFNNELDAEKILEQQLRKNNLITSEELSYEHMTGDKEVSGETCWVFRAYNSYETHIATSGWYAISPTGKIYKYDVVDTLDYIFLFEINS